MNQDDLAIHMANMIAKLDVNPHPFVTFKVPGFLPDDIFTRLRQSFPQLDHAPEKRSGSIYHNRGQISINNVSTSLINTVDTPQTELLNLIEKEPMWRDLLICLGSQTVLHALRKKLAYLLSWNHGLRILLPWQYVTNNIDNFSFSTNLKLTNNIDLFSMTHGSVVHPHKDASRKLITLLLYFSDDEWKNEWGGHTLFFKPRSNKAKKVWKKQNWSHLNHVPKSNRNDFDKMFESHTTGDYRPNLLAGFCPNRMSYHAVQRVCGPADRRRNAVSININIIKKHV